MSLFKILKGDSSRISTDITPFHNGWAYFTPDDGGFYIDVLDGGTQKRIRVTSETSSGSAVYSTLLASAWQDGAQTITVNGLSVDCNGFLYLSDNSTDEQCEAAAKAKIHIDSQAENALTLSCRGTVPAIDIPVVLILLSGGSDGTGSAGSGGSGSSSVNDAAPAFGESCTSAGDYAISGGYRSAAKDTCTVAIGYQCEASGQYSVALGGACKATGLCSTAIGDMCVANMPDSLAVGICNKAMANGDIFAIGNGTDANSGRSNAFRVTSSGDVYGLNTYNASGADYAEYFEWTDKNPDSDDRVGLFVTIDGGKIRIADHGDYVLGIVSGHPCIIGNADEDWLDRWERDEFGRLVMEYIDEDGNVVDCETDNIRRKANPDYDSSKSYVERKNRPEWSAVGMMGVLPVWDDGTCQINGYCQVADGGIATEADAEMSVVDGRIVKGYRVVERINEHIVKIVFR